MNKIIESDLRIICNSNLDWEKFKNSTVLVTGAYGMLASYMVYTLAYLNSTYPLLNIKIIAQCRNIEKAKDKFKNIPQLFITNIDICGNFNFIENVDYIIHAASPASAQYYSTDPISVINPNVIGTKNLLNLAKEKSVKGFLFLSSGDVSGKVDKELITEDDYGYLNPIDLRSCYAESKRIAETMCKCYNHQHELHTISVRPEHTYGPTLDLINDQRVFSEFISNIVNKKDIVIKSDGMSVRTFTYISDATIGFFTALLKGVSGESYNVSNNKCRIKIKDLAEMLVSMYPEKKLKVVYEKRSDTNEYIENKDNIRPTLSTQKIEKLGFTCNIDLKEGFKRTINSFIEG
jgi:nucleoside-diphosphate-sugar epimerase